MASEKNNILDASQVSFALKSAVSALPFPGAAGEQSQEDPLGGMGSSSSRAAAGQGLEQTGLWKVSLSPQQGWTFTSLPTQTIADVSDSEVPAPV